MLKPSSDRKGIYTQIQEVLKKETKDGYKILEPGCGSALISIELALNKKVDIYLLDVSKKMLAKARKNCQKYKVKANFVKAPIDKMPFDDNSFDIVFNEGVLEHLKDTKKSFEEMMRVSRKKVIIFVPNSLNPFTYAYKILSRLRGDFIGDDYGREKSLHIINLKWMFKGHKYRVIPIQRGKWFFDMFPFPFAHNLGFIFEKKA